MVEKRLDLLFCIDQYLAGYHIRDISAAGACVIPDEAV